MQQYFFSLLSNTFFSDIFVRNKIFFIFLLFKGKCFSEIHGMADGLVEGLSYERHSVLAETYAHHYET